MNIGISTSVIQRGKSGVAQYVFSLLRHLLPFAGEHRFTLFVLEKDWSLFDFVEGRMERVKVSERFRGPLRNILWHQCVLPRLVRAHQLDVLHVPSYRRMLLLQPCALVATIHDLAPFHVRKKYDSLRMFYGRVVARRLAQRQHRIIAVSRHTAEDIKLRFEIPEDRLTVVYNGVDHARFCTGSLEEAKAHVIKRRGIRQPFFFYVARLEHPGKSHVNLVEAFNRFKSKSGSGWRLVLAGPDWDGAEVIHAAIRKSAFAAHIQVLGFVPEPELPLWYRAADAFVYPSLFEGFGLPPLEAMACGCAVATSKRGALPEVVGEAAAILDADDPVSLELQLMRLATDATFREQLQISGLSRAMTFDWRRTAAATLEVYAKAVRFRSSEAGSGERQREAAAAPFEHALPMDRGGR